MAGYDWINGKSNNAVYSEENGKANKSQINKELLEKYEVPLKVKEVKDLIDSGFINRSEWHHTSKYFNRTDYYDIEGLKEEYRLKGDKFISELKRLNPKYERIKNQTPEMCMEAVKQDGWN